MNRDEHAAAMKTAGFVASRWRGEVPLQRLFWRDMLLVGTLVNLASAVAALFVLAFNGSTAVAIAVHLCTLPYNVFLMTAVWRTAERAPEPSASAARTGAVLWLILATVV